MDGKVPAWKNNRNFGPLGFSTDAMPAEESQSPDHSPRPRSDTMNSVVSDGEKEDSGTDTKN